MKKIIVLTTLLAATLSANAQRQSLFVNETKSQAEFHKHVAYMLERQEAQPLQKTTVMQERVIAQSFYSNSTTPPFMADSTVLKYIGNNSSKFNYNYMIYNLGYGFQMNSTSYPYQIEKVDVMYDSLWSYQKTMTTSPVSLVYTSAQNFNVANDITKYSSFTLDNGALIGANILINTYNTQGKHDKMLKLDYNGVSSYDSVVKIKYFYDAQGRNSIDTTYNYDLGYWTPFLLWSSNIPTIQILILVP